MAELQIHELNALGRDPISTDVLAVDTGATTMKVGFGVLQDVLVAAANLGIVASEYSTSTTYSIGDYCIHNGALYCCTTAIPTGEAWTPGHWTATDIGSGVSALSAWKDSVSVTITGNTLSIDIP